MRTSLLLTLAATGFAGLMAFGLAATAGEEPIQPAQVQQAATAAAPQQLNGKGGGQLAELPLPEPEKFKTEDGRTGWKLKIPGGRPLATPAVVGGKLFVGGGFGSHEFYVLDAKTGKRAWTFRTGDDGPTAAVVAEDCVAYNTESCTVYVQEVATGKVLWHRWLGDPLMSQPAIADGRLLMAYPANDGVHRLAAFELRTGKDQWNRKIAGEVIAAPVVEGNEVYAATVDGTLYAFDLKTGKELWSQKCNATSAPWIAAGKVYFSQRAEKTLKVAAESGKPEQTSTVTVEGFNLADPKSGKLAFAEPQAAIKAPYLLDLGRAQLAYGANQKLHMAGQYGSRGGSARAMKAMSSAKPEAQELHSELEAYTKSAVAENADGGVKDAAKAKELADKVEAIAKDPKKVADEKERQALLKAAQDIREAAGKTGEAAQTVAAVQRALPAIEAEGKAAHKEDSSVGFASAPAAAKLEQAAGNIGQAGVKSVWAYQGSRPTVIGARCYSAAGDKLRALDRDLGKDLWESKIESREASTRPATPPAFAGGKLYLGTADGRVLCVDPEGGKTLWESKVGGRIIFQPAVVDGRVYVATDDGSVICLETGDEGATGWAMWGGSAKHNGSAQ
jgi:outer membrane protein assembly factor BamB